MNSKPWADLTQSSDRSKRVRDPVGLAAELSADLFSPFHRPQSVRDLVGWLQNHVLTSSRPLAAYREYIISLDSWNRLLTSPGPSTAHRQ